MDQKDIIQQAVERALEREREKAFPLWKQIVRPILVFIAILMFLAFLWLDDIIPH